MIIHNEATCKDCEAIVEYEARHTSVDETKNAVYADDKRLACSNCGSNELLTNDRARNTN